MPKPKWEAQAEKVMCAACGYSLTVREDGLYECKDCGAKFSFYTWSDLKCDHCHTKLKVVGQSDTGSHLHLKCGYCGSTERYVLKRAILPW